MSLRLSQGFSSKILKYKWSIWWQESRNKIGFWKLIQNTKFLLWPLMTKRSSRNQLLSVNICARLLGKIRSIPVSIRILSPESLTLESRISQYNFIFVGSFRGIKSHDFYRRVDMGLAISRYNCTRSKHS